MSTADLPAASAAGLERLERAGCPPVAWPMCGNCKDTARCEERRDAFTAAFSTSISTGTCHRGVYRVPGRGAASENKTEGVNEGPTLRLAHPVLVLLWLHSNFREREETSGDPEKNKCVNPGHMAPTSPCVKDTGKPPVSLTWIWGRQNEVTSRKRFALAERTHATVFTGLGFELTLWLTLEGGAPVS